MLRRLVPASAAAALLLTGLTACASQQGEAEACVSPYSPGALSETVATYGEIGARPQVSVPADVSIKTTQRTVAQESDSADAGGAHPVGEGSLVGLNIVAYDAASGEQVYESPGFDTDSPEYVIVSEEQPNPLSEALRCAVTGDRIVLALSPEDSEPFAQQLGAGAGGSVIFVTDVLSVHQLSSEGRVNGLPSGYPAVVTNGDGQPGVVLPPRSAPSGITSAARIVGDGPAVSAEDGLIAQVLEVNWDGSIAMNSWDTGPMGLPNEQASVEAGATYRAELTGYPVGSQVVIVENQGEQERVLVIDILSTI